MKLNNKTLEKLRKLINEETQYRTGPQIIDFFNQLGFNDKYGNGFPSRWVYTDDRLKEINGKPELDKCIKLLFNPINYIESVDMLKKHITDFNKYLAFDGWQVVLSGKEVSFRKSSDEDWKNSLENNLDETVNDFLKNSYPEINLDKIRIDEHIKPILNQRINEAKTNLKYNTPLSAIFQCGSILEGLLLALAQNNPRDFNTAPSSARDSTGKVKQFHEWTLSQFINTAYEIKYIKDDVKKFSHVLRDYRNYIHPYQQLMSGFSIDTQTAMICMQVLNAAFAQISEFDSTRLK